MNLKHITLFDTPMHVGTLANTVDCIDARITARQFTQHVVVNVAKLVTMQKDAELAASVRGCDLINIDGMGVVLGARFLGEKVPERVAGIDLFHALLALAARRAYPIFLLGAEPAIVAKTVEIVQRDHVDLTIAGHHHGYFWDDEVAIVDKIRTSGARLLFVAITSPKKENFINRWKAPFAQSGVDFVMGVGGSFDVVAGKVKRAPRWMQRSGLEWFYRILQEPRRLWRRYLLTNVAFAGMLIREKWKRTVFKRF